MQAVDFTAGRNLARQRRGLWTVGPPRERDALAMLFLNLQRGGHVAEVFWSLWLFPFGVLVYRFCFLARILGVLLMAACFTYLANSFARLLPPGYAHVVYRNG
jgi:hypothetical protein